VRGLSSLACRVVVGRRWSLAPDACISRRTVQHNAGVRGGGGRASTLAERELRDPETAQRLRGAAVIVRRISHVMPTGAPFVLDRLRQMLRLSPESRREHSDGWRGAFARDEEGLTRFQRECETVTLAHLASRGQAMVDREIRAIPDNQFIRASVGATGVVVWFHDDTIGFELHGKGTRFEHWDYASPQAMLTEFLQELTKALEG
jgi:hypothetical protein